MFKVLLKVKNRKKALIDVSKHSDSKPMDGGRDATSH
jgi:hypothetical protein